MFMNVHQVLVEGHILLDSGKIVNMEMHLLSNLSKKNVQVL